MGRRRRRGLPGPRGPCHLGARRHDWQLDRDVDRNVGRCAFIATSGAGDVGTGLAQSVTVVGASGNNRGVYIERLDTGGSPAASTFHLMVQC